MKLSGFECYRKYLALKNHFGSSNYDYFLYGGKTSEIGRASCRERV